MPTCTQRYTSLPGRSTTSAHVGNVPSYALAGPLHTHKELEAVLAAAGSLPESQFIVFWEQLSKAVGWGSYDVWTWLTHVSGDERISYLKAAILAAEAEGA